MIAPLGFRMLHTSVDPFNFDPAYIAQVWLIIGKARIAHSSHDLDFAHTAVSAASCWKVASDVAYAHAHGIILGYYVLLQASYLRLVDCSTVCEMRDAILSPTHLEPPWDDRGR